MAVSFPAGWYDDPQDPTQQRYWDGEAWTDQRRAQEGPPPFQGQFGQPAATGQPQYGQPAQHGQVYGGGQQAPAQYGAQPQQTGQAPYGQPQPGSPNTASRSTGRAFSSRATATPDSG